MSNKQKGITHWAVFGSYIRKGREKKGYSLREVEEFIGFHHSNLCDVENGKQQPPKNEFIEALAKCLDLDVNQAYAKALRVPEVIKKAFLKNPQKVVDAINTLS